MKALSVNAQEFIPTNWLNQSQQVNHHVNNINEINPQMSPNLNVNPYQPYCMQHPYPSIK